MKRIKHPLESLAGTNFYNNLKFVEDKMKNPTDKMKNESETRLREIKNSFEQSQIYDYQPFA